MSLLIIHVGACLMLIGHHFESGGIYFCIIPVTFIYSSEILIAGQKGAPSPVVLPPPKAKPRIDQNPYAEAVPLHEWKQYGYWTRPFINDLQMTNSRE